jgi:CRISPR-associated protein Csd2
VKNPIENRYEFVYLFDVTDGNPNGDPDAGNMPRIDPETGHGIVTDVCLKRKIRNYVQIVKGDEPPFLIYVKEKAVLSLVREPAYRTVDAKGAEDEKIRAGRAWMCEHFYDVRTFGAVMSTKVNNCGQVRGPVQLAFGRSVDPIASLELSITRMAVETEKEAKAQSGDNRTMGRKHIVPYGLYRAHGFVSPHFAADTGFSEPDLSLLWEAFTSMFEHDHSAAHGMMAARKLFVFKHGSALGNAPAHRLFQLIGTEPLHEGDPARRFSDYRVVVDKKGVPPGVELIEMI